MAGRLGGSTRCVGRCEEAFGGRWDWEGRVCWPWKPPSPPCLCDSLQAFSGRAHWLWGPGVWWGDGGSSVSSRQGESGDGLCAS